MLTKGQHTVKIRNIGSIALSVKNLAVTMDGSPAMPSLASADFGDSKCTLAWTPVPSATGYTVYYGTASGRYTSSIQAGNATSATIPGLDNSGAYYVAVQALNANNLLSPCSEEIRASLNPSAGLDRFRRSTDFTWRVRYQASDQSDYSRLPVNVGQGKLR